MLADLSISCSLCSGWSSAEPQSPALLPQEKVDSDFESKEVWSGPNDSSGYPDKLSVRVGDFIHPPQVLRESSSHQRSRSNCSRQECPLCCKVCLIHFFYYQLSSENSTTTGAEWFEPFPKCSKLCCVSKAVDLRLNWWLKLPTNLTALTFHHSRRPRLFLCEPRVVHKFLDTHKS